MVNVVVRAATRSGNIEVVESVAMVVYGEARWSPLLGPGTNAHQIAKISIMSTIFQKNAVRVVVLLWIFLTKSTRFICDQWPAGKGKAKKIK